MKAAVTDTGPPLIVLVGGRLKERHSSTSVTDRTTAVEGTSRPIQTLQGQYGWIAPLFRGG